MSKYYDISQINPNERYVIRFMSKRKINPKFIEYTTLLHKWECVSSDIFLKNANHLQWSTICLELSRQMSEIYSKLSEDDQKRLREYISKI